MTKECHSKEEIWSVMLLSHVKDARGQSLMHVYQKLYIAILIKIRVASDGHIKIANVNI